MQSWNWLLSVEGWLHNLVWALFACIKWEEKTTERRRGRWRSLGSCMKPLDFAWDPAAYDFCHIFFLSLLLFASFHASLSRQSSLSRNFEKRSLGQVTKSSYKYGKQEEGQQGSKRHLIHASKDDGHDDSRPGSDHLERKAASTNTSSSSSHSGYHRRGVRSILWQRQQASQLAAFVSRCQNHGGFAKPHSMS